MNNMNYEWISIKEHGLPIDEGFYWVTTSQVTHWFRSVCQLYYYHPHKDDKEDCIVWYYDEDCNDECIDKIIAYMDEIIPEPYQGE